MVLKIRKNLHLLLTLFFYKTENRKGELLSDQLFSCFFELSQSFFVGQLYAKH